MAQKLLFTKQTWQYLAITVFIFSLLLSVFLFHYGLKIKNDDYCFSENLVDDRVSVFSATTTQLNSANSSFLELTKFNLNTFKKMQSVDFCYSVTGSNTSATYNVNIVNDDLVVLGTDYFSVANSSISVKRCTPLDLDLMQDVSYIGVSCVNCDVGTYLLVDYQVLGEKKEQLVIQNNQITAVTEHRLAYNFLYTLDCTVMYKKLLNAYYSIAGILFIVWLFIVGVAYLKKALFTGWW